jgi:O-antigen/teichoic acid export membrane protein
MARGTRALQRHRAGNFPVITAFIQKIRQSVLARNSAWTFAGQGTSLVIQALYFVALARLLGSSQYGVFVGATALATMVSQYASMGSGLVFLRYVSPNRTQFAEYWGNVLLCTLTISIVLVLGIQALGPHLVNRESASILLLVAIGECLCVQLTTCCGQVFQSFEKMRVTASITVLMNFLRFTVAVAMLWSMRQATAKQWAMASLLVSSISVLVAVITVTAHFGLPKFRPKLLVSRFSEGFVFAVSGSTTSAYNDLDKAMLAHYGMNAANGIYAMAYRIVDVCTIPIRSIHFAAFPQFFRFGVEGVAQTEKFARRILKRTSLLGLAVAAAMFLTAPLLPKFVGAGFASSVGALRWLCLIPLFRCFHLSAGDAMAGAGFQNYRFGLQFVAAAMNFGLNLYLIPHFTWVGAAWSSLATDGLLGAAAWIALLLLAKREKDCGVIPSSIVPESEMANVV